MSDAPHHRPAAPTLRDAEAPQRQSDFSFLWSDARLLGYAPMDATHEEFYLVAFKLLTCTEPYAADALTAFEAHAVEHFGEEEAWMVETDFPPRDCHVDEHAAVLKSVREVRANWEARSIDLDTVHGLALELFRWFPGHADYLDSALAAWMSKRQYGGKPVVLRRKG